MVMLLVLAPLLVPEFRDPNPGRFDLGGAALSLAAVLPVIYGLKKIAADGLDALPVLSLLAGLLIGVVFVQRQRTRRDPMIDLRLFRRRAFGGAVVATLIAAFAIMGSAIFTTQYLQSVLGLGPIRAALWCVLPTVAVGGAAPVAAAIAQRVERAYVVAGGFVIAALGFAGLSRITADSHLWTLLVVAGVLAIGVVTVMSLVTDMVLGAAPPERAGAASALSECATEFGGALGMAVLGSVGTAVYRHRIADSMPAGLPSGARDAVHETLGGAIVAAGGLPGRTGDAVLHAARQAFTDGMDAAAVSAALLLVAAAVLSVVFLRRAATPAAPDTGPDAAPDDSDLESALS
jgi:DHA2 family multidrug resistance protein-like MFS transporter